jgi:hypothetical protein
MQKTQYEEKKMFLYIFVGKNMTSNSASIIANGDMKSTYM